MRYALLIYEDEKYYEEATPEDWEKTMVAHNAFSVEAAERGMEPGGDALHSTAEAKTVRFVDGKPNLVTDGPYADGRHPDAVTFARWLSRCSFRTRRSQCFSSTSSNSNTPSCSNSRPRCFRSSHPWPLARRRQERESPSSPGPRRTPGRCPDPRSRSSLETRGSGR